MLKLYSSFQDYYDSALGCFVDSDVVINRKSKTEKLLISDIPTEFKEAHYTMYVKDCRTIKSEPIILIGVCGTWYYRYYDEKNIKYKYLTYDEIVNNNKKSYWFYRTQKDLNKSSFFTKDLFEKFGPILLIEELVLHKYMKENSIPIVVYPTLKDYDFITVKDPYTLLYELEHWYDTHARPDEAVVPVGDDITRLQAYGFDKKTSFRKAKEK